MLLVERRKKLEVGASGLLCSRQLKSPLILKGGDPGSWLPNINGYIYVFRDRAPDVGNVPLDGQPPMFQGRQGKKRGPGMAWL